MTSRVCLLLLALTAGLARAELPTGPDLFGQKTTQLFDAMMKKDAATLDALLAQDFLFTTYTGATGTKPQYIDAAVHVLTIESYKLKPIAVHVYGGDTAVVFYQIGIKAHVGAKPWPADLTSTDTWVKQAGAWKLVSRHSSAIAN